jgi:hypothetical protein
MNKLLIAILFVGAFVAVGPSFLAPRSTQAQAQTPTQPGPTTSDVITLQRLIFDVLNPACDKHGNLVAIHFTTGKSFYPVVVKCKDGKQYEVTGPTAVSVASKG